MLENRKKIKQLRKNTEHRSHATFKFFGVHEISKHKGSIDNRAANWIASVIINIGHESDSKAVQGQEISSFVF